MAEGRRNSLTGSGVTRGIAIGRAHLLARSELDVRQFTIERRDVVHEIGRLTTGFNAVRNELDHLKSNIAAGAPSEVARVPRPAPHDPRRRAARRGAARPDPHPADQRRVGPDHPARGGVPAVPGHRRRVPARALHRRPPRGGARAGRAGAGAADDDGAAAQAGAGRTHHPRRAGPRAGRHAAPEGPGRRRPRGVRHRARRADLAHRDPRAQPRACRPWWAPTTRAR